MRTLLIHLLVLAVTCIAPSFSDARPLKRCGCGFADTLKDQIANDEWLQQQYRSKADEMQAEIDELRASLGRIPRSRLDSQLDWLLRWRDERLIPAFDRRTGNRGIMIVHPERHNPTKIDQALLNEYKRVAGCQEIFDSLVEHERHHIAETRRLARTAGDITATGVAREEVHAYEAGLKVMRAALRAATCTKCQRCVAGKCTNVDAAGKQWNPKPFGGDDGTCCLVGYKYCPGQNFCCEPDAACNPTGGCKRR